MRGEAVQDAAEDFHGGGEVSEKHPRPEPTSSTITRPGVCDAEWERVVTRTMLIIFVIIALGVLAEVYSTGAFG